MILLHDFSGNTITFFLDPAHCRYPDKFSFLPPSVPFHCYSCSRRPVPPPGLHNRRERKRGGGGGCRKRTSQNHKSSLSVSTERRWVCKCAGANTSSATLASLATTGVGSDFIAWAGCQRIWLGCSGGITAVEVPSPDTSRGRIFRAYWQLSCHWLQESSPMARKLQ